MRAAVTRNRKKEFYNTLIRMIDEYEGPLEEVRSILSKIDDSCYYRISLSKLS